MRLAHDLSLTRPQQRGSAAPSFLLDAFPASDLEVVFSLRRVRTSYGAGPSDFIVTVRESSMNWTADVLLDPAVQRVTLNSPIANLSGGSGATLGAWVGANSAWITRDYDHSGRARHGVQAIVDRQKRLVNAGVLDTLLPGGSFVGAHCNTTVGTYQGTDVASFSPTTSLPELVTYSYGEGTTMGAVWDMNFNGNWFAFGADPYITLFANDRPVFPALPAGLMTNRFLWHCARRTDATTMQIEFHAGAQPPETRSHVGTTYTAPQTLQYGGGSAGRYQGRCAELFLFGRNLATLERDSMRTAQQAYWL